MGEEGEEGFVVVWRSGGGGNWRVKLQLVFEGSISGTGGEREGGCDGFMAGEGIKAF